KFKVAYVVLTDGRQPFLVLVFVTDPWIESATRISSKPCRPAGPARKALDDPRVAEEQPQPSKLIVDERIHRVQDHRAHCWRCAEPLTVTVRFARQLPEDWQQKALGLTGACAGHHNETLAVH